MTDKIERRLAALEEKAKEAATHEGELTERDTARRIAFTLASSRDAELKGAPVHPAALQIWRMLQPNDAERLDLLRRGLAAPSTLDQRLASISIAHRLHDLANPTGASVVRLALRRAARRKTRRPVQAKGLTETGVTSPSTARRSR
jgi:hypothetical protein